VVAYVDVDDCVAALRRDGRGSALDFERFSTRGVCVSVGVAVG
jgi:hypothetical protein